MVRPLIAVVVCVGLTACSTSQPQTMTQTPAPPAGESVGFRSGECNLVSDDDVNAAAGAGRFTKVVVSDAGCFWQENATGSYGIGMGITTWWYRGSDLDGERTLERKAGRELREVSVNGNSGFEASDADACSVYVAKNADVITWSIQSDDAAALPALCPVVRRLAQLTQDRVN